MADASALSPPVDGAVWGLQGPGSQRMVRVVLASVFAMTTCSFMAIPLLAIYLQNELRLGGWQTATVVSVHVVCTRVLPICGGVLADRTSYGFAMVLGMAVRALGFFGLAMVSSWPLLLLFSALAGLGGALYNPAVASIFSCLPDAIRRKEFTYFNQVMNAGVIVGPALGGLAWCLAGSAPFLCAAFTIGLLALPVGSMKALRIRGAGGASIFSDLRGVFQDREFVTFLLGMTLFFILFAQLYLSFPLECCRRSGSESLAASVFILNGITGIAAMFLVRGILEQHPPLALIRWGAGLAATGMAMIPLGGSLAWMLVCVAVYSVGETLVLPASDMHIAETTLAKAKGTCFGAFDLSIGLGMTLGNYSGSFLMVNPAHPHLPWLLFAGTGFALVLLLTWMIRRKHRKDTRRDRIIIIGINPAVAKYLPAGLREIGFEPVFILSPGRTYEGEAGKALEGCATLSATLESLPSVRTVLQEHPDLVRQACAVTTLYDDVFPVAQALAEAFGLAGPAAPIARLSEKAEVCRIIPEFCPESHLVHGWDHQSCPGLRASSRWILKPSRSCGAVGIVSLRDPERAMDELQEAIRRSRQAGLEDAEGQTWIIQERIHGRLVSLEGFVHHGRIHLLGYSARIRIGLTEVGNEFPGDAAVPAAARVRCQGAVQALVDRSRFRNGYFHCEFLVRNDSAYLIDANMGRIAGGPTLEQIALAYGLRSEDVVRHVCLLPLFPDRVASPFPPHPPDPRITFEIIYGLDRATVLESIALPPRSRCRHTQLASGGHEVVPVGTSDQAWIGSITGLKQDVLEEIEGITIHTSHGPMKPVYLREELDWDF